MAKSDYDFSGYATRFNVRCSDGRTIRPGAFDDCDGKRVPLVYMHDHMSPMNVLGHADLECRPDGVYCYAKCNDTESGQHSLESVKNGDLTAFSIYANKLKQHGADVVHGAIREVSLVLGGANPSATIDTVMAHADDDDEEAVIQFDNADMVLAHSDESQPDPKEDDVADSGEKTVQDVIDTMNEEQKNVLYALVGMAADGEGDVSHADDDDDDEPVDESDGEKTVQDVIDSMTEEQKNVLYALVGMAADGDTGGDEENPMKHNVFDDDENYLAQSAIDFDAFMRGSKAAGSARAYVQENEDVEDALMHDALMHEDNFGIKQIDTLFPDYHNLSTTPEFVGREMGWVPKVWNSVKRTPFERIRSVFADITADEARAKGYTKGKRKKEEIFKLLKRTTEGQTVYKKQKFHRDDVIQITDFDVISWVKGEMRMMLDEELSRAILIGDGRTSVDEDHIDPDHIRPIWGDDPFYTIRAQIGFGTNVTEDDKYWNIIKTAIRARKEYRGSGDPVMFTTEDNLTGMLLLENQIGDLKFKSKEELASRMRVSDIITVPVMEDQTRTADKTNGDSDAADKKNVQLEALIVNLSDYTVGANAGGAVNMFDDFDIDYNQMIYLIETRCSGALTKPYSAISIESYSIKNDVQVGDSSTQSAGAK